MVFGQRAIKQFDYAAIIPGGPIGVWQKIISFNITNSLSFHSFVGYCGQLVRKLYHQRTMLTL